MELSKRGWLNCLLLLCCCSSLAYAQGDPDPTDAPDYDDMNDVFTTTAAPTPTVAAVSGSGCGSGSGAGSGSGCQPDGDITPTDPPGNNPASLQLAVYREDERVTVIL